MGLPDIIAPCPIAVLGAGLAGRAAAIEAARAGMDVLLLDEEDRPAPEFPADVRDRIRFFARTLILNVTGRREISWGRAGRAGRFLADQIVLADLETRRAVPFPGWDLPGVVNSRDLPAQITSGELRPGRRAVLAGIRAELIPARELLAGAGVEVVAVLTPEAPPAVAGDIQHGRMILSAIGADRVEGASHGPVDPEDWRPSREDTRTIAGDLIVVGFGSVPNSEVATGAGCRLEFDAGCGGWVPARDGLMRTTVPGILSADPRSRSRLASEGAIAGLTAAESAGFLTHDEAQSRRSPFMEALAKPGTGDDRIRPGLFEVVDAATTLCRCEGVTCGAIRSAIVEGAGDLSSVKLLTRLGMGACQGRECSPAAAMWMARATGRSFEQVGRINPRPPFRAVSLGALSRMEMGMPSGAVAGESS